MNNGKIEKPKFGEFTVACFLCGEQKPVILYPHKKDGLIVGWVFVCPEDEKQAQGLYCEFKAEITPQLVNHKGRPTPKG